MISVRISCPVNPSESEELVLDAVMKIFPDAAMERTSKGFEGTAPGIERFAMLVRRQKILDAARAVLIKGLNGDSTLFRLNKQVATVGKVSFATKGAVLGTIDVRIDDDDDIELYIDAMLPRTIEGQEVRL
ncbi:MAG: RNA-binding domain-containing protein [Methanomassiliicoccaceae archaeon]|mgnify:CR=1 FL=1|nr:RNA-binding domain-containing protein [Methanomassiliicoccaceae archaeon]